jgi:Zn-dependent protease with chaperone function
LNFFDAQDRARRATKWLVAGYLLATALIVLGVTLVVALALGSFSGSSYDGTGLLTEHGPLLGATAIGATLFIVGASLFRTASLAAGGSRVASAAGGTLVPADVADPARRRLRNVVEEIAIASGVPVPAIYVLEAESGINAFAAGYTPGDAAIAVTRGTLDLLDRDELQGVIAHEFSHILNGDMRLNIRLMGILFGIMVLGLIGRMIIRGGYHASIVSSRRDRNAPVILVIGAGVAILGAIGVFFARIIKASVSRQREYLADASAVQFTRQTTGIAGALKKIGGYTEQSWIRATDPEEISHMLFGSGARLSGWFATHPPLAERIRALEPGFDPANFPNVDPRRRAATEPDSLQGDGSDAIAAFDGRSASPAAIVASVGNPESRHFSYAELLRRSIPAPLYDAAHSPDHAFLLAIALVLASPDTDLRRRQDALLDERIGAPRRRVVNSFADALYAAGPRFRLPLQEIGFPALRQRPRRELEFLLDLARRLIEIDDRVDLYEYCFYRILTCSLDQATDPGRRPQHRVSDQTLRNAQLNLLGLVADHGHESDAARDSAFAAGTAILGDWAAGYAVTPRRDATVAILDQSLDALLGLDNQARQRLIEAVTVVATFDQRLGVVEAELIRVVCATLDCPLPPILRGGADIAAGRGEGGTELAYHLRPPTDPNG